MAESPECSDHTSVKQPIAQAETAHTPNHPKQQPQQLMPFAGNPRQAMPFGLPFRLSDYLELVDWTGRIIREDKRGAIPSDLPAIVERLNIDPKHWLYCTTQFESRFKNLVGRAYKLRQACRQLQRKRAPGVSACQQLLG